MDRENGQKLKLPSAARFLCLVLTLMTHHNLPLHPSHPTLPGPSPAANTSTPGHPDPDPSFPAWLWSWLTPTRGRFSGVAAAAASTCVINREHQRLTEMLNDLETMGELDPGRLALRRMWARDNHTLTGACPSFRPGGRARLPALEEQSLCPWTLEQNNRTDRIPRLLWFARCLCGHCLSSEDGMSPSLYTCQPLYHRVSVIWEVCTRGEVHYRWGTESVPVGCVCTHPPARQIP